MKFTGIREAVELYTSVGFRPMPMHGVRDGACACGGSECRPGKHAPAWVEDTWKEGAEFGPADFNPGDNVALALGPWGGSDGWLVCLDCDGPFDVDGYLWGLPETLEQRSPRGRHLFYEVRPYAPLGNWVDVFETKYSHGAALDVRYARGRINVSPSETLFGGYEWHRFREPAELPESALDVILDRRRERGLPVQHTWDRGSKRP